MTHYYKNARFLTSAARISQAPPDAGLEVAFAGRSNAGKSSALNRVCQQKALARISKTPGRTRLINFFELDGMRRLVDLPGYGYAKVPDSVKRRWQQSLQDYLGRRQCLQGMILLMDCRHPLTAFDLQMLKWNRHHQIPAHLLLTKADKLGRGAASRTLQEVRTRLTELGGEVDMQLFSATTGQGLEQLHQVLDLWLELNPAD